MRTVVVYFIWLYNSDISNYYEIDGGVCKMNTAQLERMRAGKGFIAALDQSGGSTPKALKLYGIEPEEYNGDEEMFNLVHEMRTRIVTCPSFTNEKVLAAILFEMTMDRKVEGKYTADYLWEDKGIVPFLKVDKGLAEPENGVRMMKPMPELDNLLAKANERHIFGTKMRSVILEPNREAIHEVVKQQFDLARRIIDAGLCPIIEPEVDINAPAKAECEAILKEEFIAALKEMKDTDYLIFKLTLPEENNLYEDLYDFPCVVRIVALSGGYSQEESLRRLSANNRIIASFSRAFTEKLYVSQTDDEFAAEMGRSIDSIYQASLS